MDKVFSTEGLDVIGTGSFSTAYKQENGRVLLKTGDIPKQAMAHKDFPKHRLFPEVNHVGTEGSKELYDMPLYEQPTWEYDKELSPRQTRLYDAILKMSWECRADKNPDEIEEAIKSMPKEFYREKKALIEAYWFIRQFVGSGELGIEHCNQNLAMTGEKGNKKLVLLDSFYTWDSEKRGEGSFE